MLLLRPARLTFLPLAAFDIFTVARRALAVGKKSHSEWKMDVTSVMSLSFFVEVTAVFVMSRRLQRLLLSGM